MDKKIWLKVIKDELTLLEELATGMISDISLSREEVELAITRSKIVVKEFEMLLNQIPVQETEIPASPEPVVEEQAASVPPSPEPSVVFEAPSVPESPSPPVVSEDPSPFPSDISAAPSVPQSPSPSVIFEAPSPEPSVVRAALPEDPSAYTQYFKIEPLKSLKEGLSLNDRYLFQRELFNNDKSRLDEAVAALDRLANIKEAVDYLKANFKWNKSEASERFVQLVKRRFSE
ncbi:MAG: hypothetical protein WCP08_05515 [Prolixibacteraceae bacterium]